MSAYNFDPEVCFDVLQGLLKEIPSGLSEEKLTHIVSNLRTKNVKNVVELILKNVESDDPNYSKRLDAWWKDYKISDKLKGLKELVATSSSENPSQSWRPTTGEDNFNSMIGTQLEHREQLWINEIAKIDEEIKTATSLLNNHVKLIKESTQTLKSKGTQIINKQNCKN